MKWMMAVFTVATNQKFDIFIMLVILLNMISMAIEFYEAPQDLMDILHFVNVIFIAIFTAECLLKLIALRHYYFKEPWNVFDFFIVIMSIVSEYSQGSKVRGRYHWILGKQCDIKHKMDVSEVDPYIVISLTQFRLRESVILDE